MPRISSLLLRSRLRQLAACAAAATIGAALLLVPGSATADNAYRAVPAPPAVPTSADQIQNIDQVKTAIKGYYGDMADPVTVDPVTGNKDLRTFSPTSPYAHELGGIVAKAEKYLDHPRHRGGPSRGTAKKAVLFDVDDTLLNTYNYEIFSNFVYNPASNGAFVTAGVFPAVPHMVALEHDAERLGYTVFFLTGRPGTQRAATVANLTSVGYDVNPNNVYLKDYTADTWLSACATSCTTIQYKSLTRKHVESLGYDIVGNFGDQYSDLSGGYADRTFKLPNPMYYLP